MLRYVILLALLTQSCTQGLSPWDQKIPKHLQGLTEKNLLRLQEREFPEGSLRIALLGDPQGTPHDLTKVVDRLNEREDLAFILVLGDLTDYGLQHEYIWAAEALEKSRIPVLTVIGNHDAISYGKELYQKVFGSLDYVFSFGPYRFVMFNNNQFEFGSTNFDWLSQQVDNKTLVASHIPPVVDAHSEAQIAEWKAINEKAGIIASLHGHRGGKTDFYSLEAGIPYYVVPKLEGERYAILELSPEASPSFHFCLVRCQLEEQQ